MVDVVVEVRDARCPLATGHPDIEDWMGKTNKLRVVVLNRQDMVSLDERSRWKKWFTEVAGEQNVIFTNGQTGDNVQKLKRAAASVSDAINAKRAARGLKPRSIRTAVVGFPNVGKSALVNRLLGRRVAPSEARPGVTRHLRWIRVEGSELDLLDSPGVLPPRLSDQAAATRLAICNDIGEASYLASAVTAALVDEVLRGNLEISPKKLMTRYGVDPRDGTGEDFVLKLAELRMGGDVEQAGTKVLTDYRKGNLGKFALEQPPFW